jgi:hypothetical protein
MDSCLQAPLSKASSLNIFHSFKSFFIVFSHISLGRPLHFLCFQDDLEHHNVLVSQWPSLDMTKLSQTVLDRILLNWCYPKFVPYIIISDLISHCVAAYLRNIRILATLIFWMCCPFVTQHSTPYIITSIIAVL